MREKQLKRKRIIDKKKKNQKRDKIVTKRQENKIIISTTFSLENLVDLVNPEI